jgi:hypothetical protein
VSARGGAARVRVAVRRHVQVSFERNIRLMTFVRVGRAVPSAGRPCECNPIPLPARPARARKSLADAKVAEEGVEKLLDADLHSEPPRSVNTQSRQDQSTPSPVKLSQNSVPPTSADATAGSSDRRWRPAKPDIIFLRSLSQSVHTTAHFLEAVK